MPFSKLKTKLRKWMETSYWRLWMVNDREGRITKYSLARDLYISGMALMVFSFLPKNVHFISKNSVLYLFLKNVSPSKTVVCSILNNLHLSMVEGIAFYALYKSRVLVPCKPDDFCLFIGLTRWNLKKSPGIVIQFRI